MSLLALRSSHRGVRLHTFEPEDRAYTSTPTKIGGHCLDHVRNGLTVTWLNKHSSRGYYACGAERDEDEAGEGGLSFSTMLEPSMGRFGGLSRTPAVLKDISPNTSSPQENPLLEPHSHRVVFGLRRRQRRQHDTLLHPTSATKPPLYRSLAELLPDTLAATSSSYDAAGDVSWLKHQAPGPDGPNWPAEPDEVSLPPAPNHGSRNAGLTARHGKEKSRAESCRDMATAATGHTGALLAILLSKLAATSSGDHATGSNSSTTAAAAFIDGYDDDGGVFRPGMLQAGSPSVFSRTEMLHRSVDRIVRRLEHDDGTTNTPTAAPTAIADADRGGSWAWKARVDQTPHYSKLRRYDFVRELGSGSHGNIILVRKRSTGINNGSTLGAYNHGGENTSGDTSDRSSSNGRKPTSSSSGMGGSLRVLKESHFLPEAVNEARLLLLASGRNSGGRGASASVGSGFGSDREVAGAGAGGKGYPRGEVVQLHDFFVETVGHRLLAFLELEYCEGGDLAGLILGARTGSGRAGAKAVIAAAPMAGAAAARGGGGGGGRAQGTGKHWSATSRQEEMLIAEAAAARRGGSIDPGELSGGTSLDAGGFVDGLGSRGGGSAAAAVGPEARRASVGLPAAQIGRVALGLCEGLQRLHESGILHRDLKPGNVLLTKSGAVRVADLGVSTCLDPSRPLTENAAGTIPFMAPEVRKYLLGSKVAYSGKADVWAVGALVYAMAVGDPAPVELASQPRDQLVSTIGHHTGSEALSLVAHRALDPDPSRRPSAHQMTSMLQDFCKRKGWLSPPPSASRGFPMARL